MQSNKYVRYELDQSPLYKMHSKEKLIKLLHTSYRKIDKLSDRTNLYSKYSINGRSIEKPRADLKRIQKRVEDLLKRILILDFIYAPAKKKSYIDNASVQKGACDVKCLDIAAYFQSTPSERVYWFFNKRMKCSPDVSAILANILTLDNGSLPTGSPSSCIISYFSHLDMWEKIGILAQNYQCTLSVYVDDLTISGNAVPKALIAEIKATFNQYGLRSKRSKEKRYHNAKAVEITGVIVKRDGSLDIPNRQHKKIHTLRKKLTVEKEESKKHKLIEQIKGCEMQKKQVENQSY
jgi:Reverse transcriptase (RNA-dependent DNA polymerase)